MVFVLPLVNGARPEWPVMPAHRAGRNGPRATSVRQTHHMEHPAPGRAAACRTPRKPRDANQRPHCAAPAQLSFRTPLSAG